jgi:lysozyme
MVNEAGLELIKRFEGCRLKAYKCPAGIWSIGYGSTRGVTEGMRITQEQADDRLADDLKHAEDAVRRLCPSGLNENQIAALVSFTFNVGAGALARSTLLKYLKRSDTLAAACEFGKWVYADGKLVPGLVKRRTAERDLFMRPALVSCR